VEHRHLFNGAITAGSNLVSGLWDAISSMASGAVSAFNSVVDAVRNLTGWVSDLISRLSQALGLSGALGGGGSSNPMLNAGVFALGGFSTSPVQHMRVPASMFVGAPHFPAGGLTGGGMPAILHDNEALFH
jgi:hypothetical protein